ncbi:chymotrypsin inhibitor-like [Xylocopa sonorina]|uniref:chymotrypsin inhibitor-like n=1 Tax=Xylocopa sonorina TaxID=1818115 RepID=UPI00403B1C7C
MVRAAVLILCIVAVIAFTDARPDQNCGPNEEFKTCGSCEPKCGQKGLPICALNCVIGCQCKEGYQRNRDNQCVLTRDC